MVIFYIESSALVKRYLPEQGTDVMDELLDGRRESEFFVISILAHVELKSVFARLAKGKRITEAEGQELLASFWADRDKLSAVLPFENALAEEASNLLDRYSMRTLDAVHMASILQLHETARRSGDRLVVVACDQEVLQACREERIDVLNPETAPARQDLKAIREQG